MRHLLLARPWTCLALAGLTVALGASVACGGGFEPQNFIDSVRILGSKADSPFAQPGQTVNLQVLAYDGRQVRPEKMNVWWLPILCINPADDAYYACFEGFGAGGADAGAGAATGDAGPATLALPDGGSIGSLPLRPGVDLTPLLAEGPSFAITLPSDIISSHVIPQGTGTEPYGLAIAFNIACAGHVELVPSDTSSGNPIQVPIGCFDSNHNQLGPDDYVIGFTRVYAYTTWTNTNPVIQEVDVAGNAVGDAGVMVPHCTATRLQACALDTLDTVVTPASWEVDPSDLGQDGMPRHEEIWVDYFTTQGILDDDARLLYDSVDGLQSGSLTGYHPPKAVGSALIWAIVHDNRGGAAWQTVPLQVQ